MLGHMVESRNTYISVENRSSRDSLQDVCMGREVILKFFF